MEWLHHLVQTWHSKADAIAMRSWCLRQSHGLLPKAAAQQRATGVLLCAVKVVTWLTMPLQPGSDNPSLQIANMQAGSCSNYEGMLSRCGFDATMQASGRMFANLLVVCAVQIPGH